MLLSEVVQWCCSSGMSWSRASDSLQYHNLEWPIRWLLPHTMHLSWCQNSQSPARVQHICGCMNTHIIGNRMLVHIWILKDTICDLFGILGRDKVRCAIIINCSCSNFPIENMNWEAVQSCFKYGTMHVLFYQCFCFKTGQVLHS